jgi:hypothetical protein
MKTSRVISKPGKSYFWCVVKKCLGEFHGRPRSWSSKAANRLRAEIEAASPEEIELFYHAEPFDVACDLANRSLDMDDKILSRYLEIRDEKDS